MINDDDTAACELVDVIDGDGRTIAVVTRAEMRARQLPHRCVYVLVFNSLGELFVHLRTSTKDIFPSHWDVAIGGVLASGETFTQGVAREIREELGVDAVAGVLFPFSFAGSGTAVAGMVYRLTSDGPFQLQAEEIVRGEFLTDLEIARHSQKDPFCPDGLAVLAEYRRRRL